MTPQVYLAIAYQNDDGEIAIVLSALDGDCSFITLRGKRVTKYGELGKVNPLKLSHCDMLFTTKEA